MSVDLKPGAGVAEYRIVCVSLSERMEFKATDSAAIWSNLVAPRSTSVRMNRGSLVNSPVDEMASRYATPKESVAESK